MRFEVKVDCEKECLRVYVTGLLSCQTRSNVFVGISNQLSVTGYKKVIIDVTESSIDDDDPVCDAHDLVRFMKKIGFGPDVKLAFIYADSETHRQYFETICFIEGLKLKYFRKAGAAEHWVNCDS